MQEWHHPVWSLSADFSYGWKSCCCWKKYHFAFPRGTFRWATLYLCGVLFILLPIITWHAWIRCYFCAPNPDGWKEPTKRMKTPVEAARHVQNLPAMNAVVSEPITLLGQGSPSMFHIQPYPLITNGQTLFAVVPTSNQIPQVCLAQPTVSMPNVPVGQFNSVSNLHSGGHSVTTNRQTLPNS